MGALWEGLAEEIFFGVLGEDLSTFYHFGCQNGWIQVVEVWSRSEVESTLHCLGHLGFPRGFQRIGRPNHSETRNVQEVWDHPPAAGPPALL